MGKVPEEHKDSASILYAYNIAVFQGLDPDAWLLVNSEIAIALEKRGEIKRIQYADPAAEISALRAELERKDARIHELEAQAGLLIAERDKWKAKAESRGGILRSLIYWDDHEHAIPLAMIVDNARAAIEEE